MNNAIILATAYRRTGKDKLFKILSGGESPEIKRFLWRIYKHPTKNVPISPFTHSADENIKYIRKSFADELREESSKEYTIPLFVDDSAKDIKQFIHYKSGELVSARDIYIEWAKYRRDQDINYWCKKAFTDFYAENYCCVVTDWRYPNEVEYLIKLFENIITVRLYRSDVPVPPYDVDSEHSLDNYQTDYLLIRDDIPGEYEKALELFPQYKDYIPCGTL